ncbi:protein translocase subunit SecD [Candidatus Bipolaricaulota bacterium]|nr:protein translocase subunit SecD [Candidatus Bipolaricaulota bacterium]
MKRRDWIYLGVTLAVIFAAIGLLYPFWPFNQVIKLGLDLQGGVRLVLQAQGLEEMTPAQRQDVVDRLVTIFAQRVDQYGLANAEIRPMGNDRVEVKIPGAADPEQARELLGRTAILEFRKVIDEATNPDVLAAKRVVPQEILPGKDPNQYFLVEGDPLLTGDVLDNAEVRVSQDPRNPGLYILLTFNRAGAERFVEALRRLQVGDRLAIVLDGVVYSAPAISSSIKEAAAQGWRAVQNSTTITGRFSYDEAKLLSVVLRSGALPTRVTVIEEQRVGPTLGAEYVRRGALSLLISFVLVVIYMLLYYRWYGIIAALGIALTMLILFAALRAFHATLTLPGIAGLVLTLGMAVDANVLIYERIKEERRAGKAVRAAVPAGFQRALSAIVDSNITTLIAALIFFLVGSGPVQGFAITLSLGVVSSMFAALVFCRLLLENTVLGERVPLRVVSTAK